QHALVVLADRAHVLAAAAAGDDARAAQDAFPEVEALLGAQHGFLLADVGLADDAADELGELREAVRRPIAVAGAPVAVPVPDRVPRAGLEAPPAGRAEAQGRLHLPIGLDLDRGQHARQHDARPVFGR